MFEQQKKDMQTISNYAGARLDFVQGGGGNSSYKFDDTLMAIKASGYSMSDITPTTGYVTVNYAKILSDYSALSIKTDVDIEAETLRINLDSITPIDDMESTRPSVEVGFHSYLKRAVIHTHSVYSNLLCCSKEGRGLLEEIFKDSGLGYVYLPFISPGYTLSKELADAVHAFKKKNDKQPELIFMHSHGIIAHADNAKDAITIHERANELIKNYFKAADFPPCILEKSEDGYTAQGEFLGRFIEEFSAGESYFENVILYPDQMVYLGTNIGNSIIVDGKEMTVSFKMSEKKAQTALEVMTGVAYIISEIKRLNLTLETLCEEGVEFIRNWESEKYRASLEA